MAYEHNDIVTKYVLDAAVSGGSGGLAFPTFTVDWDNETAICDMTFAEISAAIEAGRCVMAKDDSNAYYPLTLYHGGNDGTVNFSISYATDMGAFTDKLIMSSEDVIEIESTGYPVVP